MSRRRFLKTAAWLGAIAPVGGLSLSCALAQQGGSIQARRGPVRLRMAGYGPATTSFSLGLKRIGDTLAAKFPDDIEPRYVYNIMDVGYQSTDLGWLVDSGVLTLAYFTLTEGIPELELGALPFLFADARAARAAMDGALGHAAAARMEADNNYRVLGFFENGFRHVSNSVRPVHTPADMRGLKIRVLASQLRTFELLGAEPTALPLSQVLPGLKAGTLDGQENPFANSVTYGLYPYQHYHTATYHSYLSRPIFMHRPTFDALPEPIQREMRAAVREAIEYQRTLHDAEEEEAAATIRAAGGEIVELSAAEHAAFAAAVAPIYDEARKMYPRELLELVNL